MPRLLIIEDELEAAESIKEYLSKKGIDVLTAANGEEGLKLLASEKPDLALVDLRLGQGFSGLEVLRRAKPLKIPTQFIVLTAVADRNVTELATGLGASVYLTKPFALEELERLILSRLKI